MLVCLVVLELHRLATPVKQGNASLPLAKLGGCKLTARRHDTEIDLHGHQW